MKTDLETDPALDEHLRRCLRAVADTVTDAPAPAVAPAPRSRRPGRRIAVGLAVAALVAPLAAAALFGEGPEYVDQVPPDHIVASGKADGGRYWLTESDRTDNCGGPVTGVELVAEAENVVGREWNTVGFGYGEPGSCGYDDTAALRDPSLSYASGAFVGDTVVWVMAVHPDVTGVRVETGDRTERLEVYTVDGAGYTLTELAPGTRFRTELLIGDEVVPGSEQVRTAPSR